jgi:hypothetical protein
MVASSFIVLDQDQSKWFVGEGDPAFPACQLLSATFSHIVLPRDYVLHGMSDLTASAVSIQRIERAWAKTGDEDLRLEYLHRVRLFDCLHVLEGKG